VGDEHAQREPAVKLTWSYQGVSDNTARQVKRALNRVVEVTPALYDIFMQNFARAVDHHTFYCDDLRDTASSQVVKDDLKRLRKALVVSKTTYLMLIDWDKGIYQEHREDVCDAYELLSKVVDAAYKEHRPGRVGNPYSRVDRKLVVSLADIFFRYTGKKPTAYPDGPFADIVRAAFSEACPKRDVGGRKVLTSGIKAWRTYRQQQASAKRQ
jgi:hypothetical protein